MDNARQGLIYSYKLVAGATGSVYKTGLASFSRVYSNAFSSHGGGENSHQLTEGADMSRAAPEETITPKLSPAKSIENKSSIQDGDSGSPESYEGMLRDQLLYKVVPGLFVGGVAVMAAPLALATVGFTAGGIASGSAAAGMMSSAAIANGGGVAVGSTVAILQSAGAAGIGMAGNAAVFAGASAATTGVTEICSRVQKVLIGEKKEQKEIKMEQKD